jgi:hypothetical protein
MQMVVQYVAFLPLQTNPQYFKFEVFWVVTPIEYERFGGACCLSLHSEELDFKHRRESSKARNPSNIIVIFTFE